MSCRPEAVTGFVDDALEPAERARVAGHLETCAVCREQAEAERSLRARLRSLKPREARPGFETEMRAALRGGRIRRRARWLLPLAAGLALLGLWLRGSPEVVALELAFDHWKCFRKDTPPAKVVSHDPAVIVEWFAGQGTALPSLPSRAASVAVEGARYCPLFDGASVAHVYYRQGERHVSLFVVPRGLRMDATLRTTALGRAVHLQKRGDSTLAVVGESAADVEALAAELVTRAANLRVTSSSLAR